MITPLVSATCRPQRRGRGGSFYSSACGSVLASADAPGPMSYSFLKLPQVKQLMDVAFLACRRQANSDAVWRRLGNRSHRVKARVTIRLLNGIIRLRCQCENYMTLGREACPTVAGSVSVPTAVVGHDTCENALGCRFYRIGRIVKWNRYVSS